MLTGYTLVVESVVDCRAFVADVVVEEEIELATVAVRCPFEQDIVDATRIAVEVGQARTELLRLEVEVGGVDVVG